MIIRFSILMLAFVISSEYAIKAPFQSNSQISYLGRHPAHNWTGISSDFKGGIICADLNDCVIKIQIPIESFHSGNASRDSNMLYYVESHKYRYVTFYSDSFEIDVDILSAGQSMKLSGNIDFHGVKKNILFNTSIYKQGDFLKGEAEFDIYLSHHNVDRPALLFAPISDQVSIKCDLYCLIDEFRGSIGK